MGNGDEPVSDDVGYAQDPLSEEVSDVASAIMGKWEERTDSPFAGVMVDQRAGVVTVYRVTGDAVFDADVLSHRSDRVTVVLVDAPRNDPANQEIVQSILAEPDLPIHIYVIGARYDGTGVDVLAEGDIPAAQMMLDRKYGDGFVHIERGVVAPA